MKTLKVVDSNQQSTQLIEYGVTDAALAELREKNKDIVVTDSKSLKAARVNKSELVGLRSKIEASRKEKKADALEFGKRVDAEAKRITAIIEEIEAAVIAPIEAYEAKLAAEKAEKERIEQERIQRIRQTIDQYFGASALLQLSGASSGLISQAIQDVQQSPVDQETFQELLFEAEQQKVRFLLQLESLLADTRAKEEEDKRLQREALRLERQAEEQAERERVFAEQQKAAQAAINAENARLKAEQDERDRIEREKLEAERAELARIKAEQAAKQKLIDDQLAKIEAEKRAAEEQKQREEFERQAKIKAKEKLEREQREKEEAERAAKLETERKAALLPDKDKLTYMAKGPILNFEFPDVDSPDAKVIIANVDIMMRRVHDYVMRMIELIDDGEKITLLDSNGNRSVFDDVDE